LQQAVADACGLEDSRAAAGSAAGRVEGVGVGKARRRNDGLLAAAGVKGSACYRGALNATRARAVSEGEGATWWAQEWLDKVGSTAL